MTRAMRLFALGPLLVWSVCCNHGGPYTWANRFPDQVAGDTIIHVGDVVRITVVQQEQLSGTARVRPDGRIPMALVHDVEVAGVTAAAAAARIQTALQGFLVAPDVQVGLEERAPARVAVLGQVAKPGTFEMDPSQGVLHALAMAGGLTEFADEESIYVMRIEPARTMRLRFSLDMLRRGEGSGKRFSFQSGDVLMVDE